MQPIKTIADSISFVELTETANLSYEGVSYGASWGDFNNDTYPDFYVSNHQRPGLLYINQKDGTFENLTSEIFLETLWGDPHGAAWADFDNDGDQDLVQLRGGGAGAGAFQNPNHFTQFFINDGEKLRNQAINFGVEHPAGRGRTPLWLDFDQDGLLDLYIAAGARNDGLSPPTIFRQTSNGFVDANLNTGFEVADSPFSFLSDFSGDGNLDFVVMGYNPYQLTVYDTQGIPFEDLTTNLSADQIGGADMAVGDFNGDLLPDLYVTRLIQASDLFQDGSNSFRALFDLLGTERGTQFNTSGDVTFRLGPPWQGIGLTPSDIYIGANGLNPTEREFTLSPNDPNVEGIFPHEPGVDNGTYIGYDSNLERWQLFASNPGWANIAALIQSTEPITELTAIDFNPDPVAITDQVFFNTSSGFINQSEEAGINEILTSGHNAVTGDFDNDMDLDIYVVTSNSAENLPNLLYENQGDGTFVALPDAGGAEGTNLGVGDSVTVADYDLDGFLDLFLTNGGGVELLRDNGVNQLFRNQGNDNNWLEIDLEGIISNRDGIGAQILATAGGITQLREQSGGIHHRTQNHQRIHFGLADNNQVDELIIKWPSGVVQKIENIPANQLIEVVEPSDSFLPGQPDFSVSTESGVFLWKDSFDGPYHLRTVGSESATEFVVNLITTDELGEIIPIGLETDDTWEVTEFGFSLNSKLWGAFQDGLDFYLKPGAKALLSVTQDGVANPRQIHVGLEGSPLSPTGWIVNSDELPVRPSFNTGEDLGLFVGQGENADEIEFRWNGDGNFHSSNLSVMTSEKTATFSPVALESNDELSEFTNGVDIQGQISTWWDGLDVEITEQVNIGFTYQQDGLMQTHRVNTSDDLLGVPNAYSVPLATPYGVPEYDPSVTEGIFLWLDEEDFWNLRVTGSEEGSRYVGSIVSDQAAIDVQTVALEETDIVNTTDPSRIDFDFQVWQSWEDGLDFRFPAGAALTLNLEELGEGSAALLHVGAEQWSVSEVPLDLSGWA